MSQTSPQIDLKENSPRIIGNPKIEQTLALVEQWPSNPLFSSSLVWYPLSWFLRKAGFPHDNEATANSCWSNVLLWLKRLRLAFLSWNPKANLSRRLTGSAELSLPNPEPVYGRAGRITDLDEQSAIERIF